LAVPGYLWHGWLAAGGVQRLVEHPQESMSVKADRVYLDCLSTGQGCQSRRQFLSRRHLGVVDQNRNDSNVVSAQGGLHLEPYEVGWVINASRSLGIGDRQPLGSDQGEKNLA
jgi:hypothetical protein